MVKQAGERLHALAALLRGRRRLLLFFLPRLRLLLLQWRQRGLLRACGVGGLLPVSAGLEGWGAPEELAAGGAADAEVLRAAAAAAGSAPAAAAGAARAAGAGAGAAALVAGAVCRCGYVQRAPVCTLANGTDARVGKEHVWGHTAFVRCSVDGRLH